MREDDLIRCYWDGKHLVPDGNKAVADLCDRLGAGEVVRIDLNPARSGKSHRHQFGFVRVAWENLPEAALDAPFARGPDALRKHALIRTGYCRTGMVAVGCPRRADRVAAQLTALATSMDGYAVVSTDGAVVYCFTAESQSLEAMGAERFQESKQAILEWLAGLIGVEPDELARMGKERRSRRRKVQNGKD